MSNKGMRWGVSTYSKKRWARQAKRALAGYTPLTLEQQREKHLLDNSIPEPNTGCRLWIGPLSANDGRPRIGHRLAARIAYKLWKGELSKADDVHHTCRTKECVEPGHLEALAPGLHRLHH